MSVSSATDRPTDLVVRARYDRGAVAKNNSTTDSFVAARPLKLYCCTDVVALAATNAAPRPPRQTSKATKEEYKRNIRSIVSFFLSFPLHARMGFQMVAGLDLPPCSALPPPPWPVGRQAGESYKSTFCLMCRDARGGVAALLLPIDFITQSRRKVWKFKGASIAVKKDYLTEQFLFIVLTKNQGRGVLLPPPVPPGLIYG